MCLAQLPFSAYTPPPSLCALLSCSGYQALHTQKVNRILCQRKACLFGRWLCAGALVCSPSRAHPAPCWNPSAASVPLSASRIFLLLVPRRPMRPCLSHLLSLPGVNRWLAVTYFSGRKPSQWQLFPTSTFLKLVSFGAMTVWCLPCQCE